MWQDFSICVPQRKVSHMDLVWGNIFVWTNFNFHFEGSETKIINKWRCKVVAKSVKYTKTHSTIKCTHCREKKNLKVLISYCAEPAVEAYICCPCHPECSIRPLRAQTGLSAVLGNKWDTSYKKSQWIRRALYNLIWFNSGKYDESVE